MQKKQASDELEAYFLKQVAKINNFLIISKIPID